MVLIAFRHGLRAGTGRPSFWDQVDLQHALLHVRRLKNGSPATHPLTGKELRALRRLEREQELKSPFVFTSERGTPFTKRGFQAMVERAGKATGFDMKIQAYLGHRAGTDSVQKLIPGLTAPAASFEATVGGSAARGSSNFSRKSR
jgi:hypothetical protein